MDSFNVVVCWPSYGLPKNDFTYSLARLISYFATVRVFPEIPSQKLEPLSLEGSGIGAQRDDLVNAALRFPDVTHLCFIDEDMGFNPDVLHILARKRQPIVGCNYRMRVPPADFTALSLDRTHRIQTTQEMSGLEEAFYIGFGFSLFEKEVFEKVEQPRFLQQWNAESRRYTTEDLPFFLKAREAGYKCYVDHDASKRIWHKGGMSYCWNEDYSTLGKNFMKPEQFILAEGKSDGE